jgi:hypothetical protein
VTKQAAAEELFRRLGITFAVYAEGGSTERLIPFDLIPRVLAGAEWELVQRGCIQRVKAINVFLYGIYHDQEIIKAGLVPPEFVLLNSAYRPEMHGVEPPNRVYAHIAGIDLVRTGERDFFVLEDNVRTPSGVSYVLENREIMLFPMPSPGNRSCPLATTPRGCWRICAPWRRATTMLPSSCCSRQAATTALISSMYSSPSRWASSSLKAAICSFATVMCGCAPQSGPLRAPHRCRRITNSDIAPSPSGLSKAARPIQASRGYQRAAFY